MGKSPAFQFYPGDWLSSPNVAMMSPEQEGAYIRLLCYAWADPDCSLPDDDDVLARLSRLNEGWFNGGSTVVRKCFNQHPTKPERIVNQRLLKEREKQEEWRKKSVEGGIKSGKSRRSNAMKGGSQMVEPNGNSSSSSSSSSSESESKLSLGVRKSRIPTREHWLEYAKEVGFPERDAEKAYLHYDGNGWYRGKTKIVKWKSCLQTCFRLWQDRNGTPDTDSDPDEATKRINRPT